MEKNKIKHKFDLNRVRAENVHTKESYKKNEYAITKLRSEKEEVEAQLQQALSELRSYKVSLYTINTHSLISLLYT